MLTMKLPFCLLLSMCSALASPVVVDFSRYKTGDELEDGDALRATGGELEFRGGVPDWNKDETLFGKATIQAEGNARLLNLETQGSSGVFPWVILRTSDTFKIDELRRDLKFMVEFKVLDVVEGNGSGVGLFSVDVENPGTGAFDILKSNYTALALRWESTTGFALQRSVAGGTEQSYWGGEWHDGGGGIFLKMEAGLGRNLRATFKVSVSSKKISFSLFDMDSDTMLLNEVKVSFDEMSEAVKASDLRFSFGKLMENSLSATQIQVSKIEVSLDK